jgi:hypothetical protein
VDETLALTVNALAGTPFLLRVDLSVGTGSHGGQASVFPHNLSWLSFEGLPERAGIVSCQGFEQTQPTPVTPTSWSWIKARHP